MTTPDHLDSTRKVYDYSADYYASAVGTSVTEAFERPLDRAVLRSFAEELAELDGAHVLDIGCGVGRITAHLHEFGLDVRGIDLSPGMIAAARSAHPHLTFDVAPMTQLPVDDGSITAAVLWYSIIHTPPDRLDEMWAELARVVEANGLVLFGFQAGDNEEAHRDNAYGSSTTMTWYRHNVDHIVLGGEQAGFCLRSRAWRVAQLAHESTPQAFLIFRYRA